MNLSGRKTAIQALLHAKVPSTDVMQLTGHKNVQSLNSHSCLSLDQQKSMSKTLSSYVPIKPELANATSHEDFCEMDNADLMFPFELDALNTLPASKAVVTPSKNSNLQPMATNGVQVPTEADGSTINYWTRVFVPSMMTEPSCDHDKVSDSDNMTFNIGSFMPNQLNTATKPKPSKFKFLNGVINGNIPININTSSHG